MVNPDVGGRSTRSAACCERHVPQGCGDIIGHRYRKSRPPEDLGDLARILWGSQRRRVQLPRNPHTLLFMNLASLEA